MQFLSKFIFFAFLHLFLIIDVFQQNCENSENLNKSTLCKIYLQSLFNFAKSAVVFTIDKTKNIQILKIREYNKMFYAEVATTKGFALDHDESSQIYFWVKLQVPRL